MNWLSSKIAETQSTLKTVIKEATKQLIEEGFIESDKESEAVGITDELREFVLHISHHPSTFTQFPLNNYQSVGEILTPWQERHAMLVLEQVPDLSYLRFKLCPSKLNEATFWKIYFLLVRNKLGHVTYGAEAEAIAAMKATVEKRSQQGNNTSAATNNNESSHTPTKKTMTEDNNSSNSNNNSNTQADTDSNNPVPLISRILTTTSPFSSPNSKGNDIEQYFEEKMKTDLDQSFTVYEAEEESVLLDPNQDNYFSFDSSLAKQSLAPVTTTEVSPPTLVDTSLDSTPTATNETTTTTAAENNRKDSNADNNSNNAKNNNNTQPMDTNTTAQLLADLASV